VEVLFLRLRSLTPNIHKFPTFASRRDPNHKRYSRATFQQQQHQLRIPGHPKRPSHTRLPFPILELRIRSIVHDDWVMLPRKSSASALRSVTHSRNSNEFIAVGARLVTMAMSSHDRLPPKRMSWRRRIFSRRSSSLRMLRLMESRSITSEMVSKSQYWCSLQVSHTVANINYIQLHSRN
jgi:hypothetical protein